jgi:hypothetical protein
MMKQLLRLLCLSSVLVLFGSCIGFLFASDPTRTGLKERINNLQIEWTASQNTIKSGKIITDYWPNAVIHFTATVNKDETLKLAFTSLDWFNNWTNGWTEATFLLEGEASLGKNGTTWTLTITKQPEIIQPSKAEVRYFDQFLNPEQGLAQITRRWDRIRAVAEFLHTKFDSDLFADFNQVRKFCFPEIYGYATAPKPNFQVRYAESINWNVDYTKENFSEQLHDIRNSGTMFRDWEESPSLWVFAYTWKNYWAKKTEATIIIKE